jgi:hypothetical protein
MTPLPRHGCRKSRLLLTRSCTPPHPRRLLRRARDIRFHGRFKQLLRLPNLNSELAIDLLKAALIFVNGYVKATVPGAEKNQFFVDKDGNIKKVKDIHGC